MSSNKHPKRCALTRADLARVAAQAGITLAEAGAPSGNAAETGAQEATRGNADIRRKLGVRSFKSGAFSPFPRPDAAGDFLRASGGNHFLQVD
jgi:hypothetical protein